MRNNSKFSILKTISAILFAAGIAAFFLPFVKIVSGVENLIATGANFLSSLFGGGQMAPDTAGDVYKGFEVFKGLLTGNPDLGIFNNQTVLLIVFIAIFAVAALGIVFGFVPALKKLAAKLVPVFGIAGAALLMVLVALFNYGLQSSGNGMVNGIANTLNNVANAFGQNDVISSSVEVQIGLWVSFGAFVAAAVLGFIAMRAYSGNESYEALGEGGAAIIGVTGMYKDVTFPLDNDEELIIGRDAMLSHIVITSGAEKISRKHITVSFDSYDNVYTVTDNSSNGTYLADGTRLVANIPVKLQRGTVIYLAKRDNTFKLG